MAKHTTSLLDSLFKLSAIFGILLVSFSLAYYFLAYLPQKDSSVIVSQPSKTDVSPIVSITPIVTVTTTANPTTKITPKPQIGCIQSKLDEFRKLAISQGYDASEIDAYIAAQKANGCKTPTQLDVINDKLDKIRNCQTYGQCY